MAKRCVSALTPQHWELLLVGAAHANQSVGKQVHRVLDAFRPSLIFLELDQRDFTEVRNAVLAKSDDHFAVQAVPECASAMRWAYSCESGANCRIHPIDRDQTATRRRLTNRFALKPLQLAGARRYWGATNPTSNEKAFVSTWRAQLKRDCPVLHDVLVEERDEFMAFQILTKLEAHLARNSTKHIALASASKELRPIETLLQRRTDNDLARINAALSWSLDRYACGEGKLLELSEWSWGLEEQTRIDPKERVVVICGPAHIDGIATILEASLDIESRRRTFLAHNAALFPHLLVNADRKWPNPKDDSRAKRLEQLAEAALTALPGESTTQNHPEPPAASASFSMGPLTQLVQRFSSNAGHEANTAQTLPPYSKSTVFVHERLRDLHSRPLPVWPAVLVAYVAIPVLFFIVLPAKFDMYWLQNRIRL